MSPRNHASIYYGDFEDHESAESRTICEHYGDHEPAESRITYGDSGDHERGGRMVVSLIVLLMRTSGLVSSVEKLQ